MKLRDRTPLLFGAKRIGDICDIVIKRGQKRRAVYIGRGRFTCAFATTRYVFLYTFYNDHSKDILAFGPNNNPHLPVVNFVGTLMLDRREIKVYKSRFYKTNPCRDEMGENNYRIMKALQRAHNAANDKVKGDLIQKGICHAYNDYVIKNADVPDKMIDALKQIERGCIWYGDHYLFDDFRRQNMGLDSKGNLILVDPVFDAERIYKDLLARQGETIWRIDNLMS